MTFNRQYVFDFSTVNFNKRDANACFLTGIFEEPIGKLKI